MIRIVPVYPELLSIYADRGNVRVLEQLGPEPGQRRLVRRGVARVRADRHFQRRDGDADHGRRNPEDQKIPWLSTGIRDKHRLTNRRRDSDHPRKRGRRRAISAKRFGPCNVQPDFVNSSQCVVKFHNP